MYVSFLMIRRPPRSKRTDTLFPYTTRFRSLAARAGRGATEGEPRRGRAAARRLAAGVRGWRRAARPDVRQRHADDRGRADGGGRGAWPDAPRRRAAFALARFSSDEGRVGKECVSTCRSRVAPVH